MSIYVGIGASAGGLKALEKLVASLPADSDYIYFIAQHLDSKKQTSLMEILSRYSTIPVENAKDDCNFLSNHIYIIPPKYNLVLKNNSLFLEECSTKNSLYTPNIDILFESLASYKANDSIGIILTGSGNDGTIGLQKIKENGGITLVQSPEEAEFTSMPQNAIDTLEVDYILPIEKIAIYLSHSLVTSKPSASTSLNIIMKRLSEKEGLNTQKYKKETIERRVNKRALLVHAQTQEDYLKYIDSHSEELSLLAQDILVGVTNFFRDNMAFEALERKVFLYLKDKPENYELRVWSAGCSTGEEAYSLSILISKISKQLKKSFHIRIFATDIDDKALDKARKAIYSKESLKNVQNTLVEEYFYEEKGGYRVADSIRQNIVFTHHNILSDPPFVNQDLICCRNLLIYISPEAQKDIFTLFHHSLKKNALLFLGSSESTMLSSEYFTPVSFEYKIYQKEKVNNPPKISSHYFSKHLEARDENITNETFKEDIKSIENRLTETIFSYFSQNCIIINKRYSIVYKKGELPFLKLPDGFVTFNILDNLDKRLRYDVRVLIKKTFESQKIQMTNFIEIGLPSSKKTFLRVIASPFYSRESSSELLLYFQQLDSEELKFDTEKLLFSDESSIIKNLSTQLSASQNELHLLSDELTLYRETTQALSEELQSTNEELQSSNEELETSNEELQSSNEELQSSILDTQRSQEELSLILNSSQDAIIGLSLEGNHTFANSSALEMLGYSLDELIGKNGHNLWHYSKVDEKHCGVEDCPLVQKIKSGVYQRSEDVFYKKNGAAFDVEILQNPIIKNKKIVGTILSFHDITEKKRLKKISEHEHQLADLYLNISGNIVMKLDINGNIKMINSAGAELLEASIQNIIGKNWFDNYIPTDIAKDIKSVFKSIILKDTEFMTNYTNTVVDTNKKEYLISWHNSPIYDIDKNIIGVIASGADITQKEVLLKKISKQENLYKRTFEEADIGIAHVSLDGKWIDTNEYLTNLLGYTNKEFQKLSVEDITYTKDITLYKKMIDELLSNKRDTYHLEKRYVHKNGDVVWVSLNMVILKDEFKKPLYLLKIVRDITEIKLLTYQLEIEKNELKNIIEFTPIPIMIHKKDGEVILVNKAFEKNTGYTIQDVPNMTKWMEKLYVLEDEQTKVSLKNDYEDSDLSRKIEHIVSTRDEKKHIWILKSANLHTSLDNQEHFISSVLDVTDIKKKDEIMLVQSRQAAMGDMLAMIAHQWKQPLSILSMSANLIKAQQELEEEITDENIAEFIRVVDKQTQYLATTIDDFRDFFKPDKVKEKVLISQIFNKLKTLIEKSLESNAIDLELPENQEIEIWTYQNQLIQVILNLVNNAKDAIKEKSPNKGLIRFTIEEKKDETIIGVCDNGGGIDPSIKKTISQPYVSTKSKNGTGLGLYMSTVIVRKHLGGRLYWTSDIIGSCFYVTLPKTASENGEKK